MHDEVVASIRALQVGARILDEDVTSWNEGEMFLGQLDDGRFDFDDVHFDAVPAESSIR